MGLKLRLFDVRQSRFPAEIGLCKSDIPQIADTVNAVQQRLLYCKEAGDEGWYGTWAEMAFQMSYLNPYLTLPRGVARLEEVNVCNYPVQLNNQFYEYLRYGNGRLPKANPRQGLCLTTAYQRNMVPCFNDPPTQPFVVQCYATDPADVQSAARVLVQGLSAAGDIVYSMQANGQVTGEYVVLASPFATSPTPLSRLTGIQKDITVGPVRIMSVDTTTGAATLLLTMEPGEQTASYRRYYFNQLPRNCCGGLGESTAVIVTAMAKLDLLPVKVDQDYLLIQNLEALIAEAGSMRYASMDSTTAKQLSAERHQSAVRYLNGELSHWIGKLSPAVNFKPFGSASFNRVTARMI